LARANRPLKKLINQMLSLDNMRAAWEETAENKGAPGMDGVSIARWRHNWEERLTTMAAAVRANTYHPSRLRRFSVPKKDTMRYYWLCADCLKRIEAPGRAAQSCGGVKTENQGGMSMYSGCSELGLREWQALGEKRSYQPAVAVQNREKPKVSPRR
jgi:hypothetical protein